MRPQYQCPLGDKDCQAIDKGLTLAANLKSMAQDCIDCGLDFQPVLDEVNAREKLLLKLKQKFFPNRV